MANYIKTTDFAIKDGLPSGDPGKVVRGTEIDVEFEAIETAVGTKSDLSSPQLTGTPTAPTAGAATNNNQIATTAFVHAAIALDMRGLIVLWSGAQNAIPAGWILCDGGGGSPDLRDKFVLGAGSSYGVGAQGGSRDAVLVSHSHSASASVSDPGHSHSYQDAGRVPFVYGSTSGPDFNSTGDVQGFQTGGSGTGISVGVTVNANGQSGVNANMPPYYALCYIMKT